jgi:hypothetical protein
VCLLAPEAGRALVGTGASEVDALLPWDGPELARRIAGETTSGPLDAALARADLVIAYTRDDSLAQALRPRAGRLLRHDPAPPPGSPHISRWLAEPITALGLPLPDSAPPDLCFSSAERGAAAELLSCLPERFLALHPGSGSPAKCWPGERFGALAGSLAGPTRFLVALGPAEEDQRWEQLAGALVARELPLRSLGALLSLAGLYVGNDSGVSHLAAASGARTLALFGPTAPDVWLPVGRGVCCLRAPDRTLASLSVEEVAHAAAALRGYVNGERTSTRLIKR